MISAGEQVLASLKLGAMTDGRLAREAVANGISPANATDIEGMTAVRPSAAKVSEPKLSSGTALKLKDNPNF